MVTACIRNSGFSAKSKVSAFNKSQYQTESEVLFNPLLLIHAKRCAQFNKDINKLIIQTKMNINGSTLTLIGGIISAIGILISLYGAYKSSVADENWQKKMDSKTTTILESATDRSKADEALMSIREANFKKELARNFSNVNVDQIIENAQNIEDTKIELERAKLDKLTNKKAEFVKLLRPILLLFTEQMVNILVALENKGYIIHKDIQFSVDKDWWLRGGGDLIQAKTKNNRHIHLGYQPTFSENNLTAEIYIPGLQSSNINFKTGFTLRFLDGSTFNMSPKEINDSKTQKMVVAAISRAMNETITFQLGK